jgi:ATP-dependent DNA helicase PIF1
MSDGVATVSFPRDVVGRIMESAGLLVAAANGWNLVCTEWASVWRESLAWKAVCAAAGVPFVVSGDSAGGGYESVDWHGHYMSAAQSRRTRCAMLAMILERKNVFMTGPGGVGKSLTIQVLQRKLTEMRATVAVVAMTGVAAQLIGGETLHRWAGTGLARGPAEVLCRKLSAAARYRWRNTSVLIIDEISMCQKTLFDKLDAIGRTVRRRPDLLFGGIQIIACGDFFQLPPVPDRDVPGSEQFVFQSRAWEEGIHGVFVFSHIYRSTDARFSALLLRARRGELSPGDSEMLRTRLRHPLAEARARGITPTRMHSLRAEVDQFNDTKLAEIRAPARTFEMHVESRTKVAAPPRPTPDIAGAAAVRSFVPARQYAFSAERAERAARVRARVPEKAVFKDGAQVILVVNLDAEAGLVNGSRGVVTDAHGPRKGVEVAFACGETRVIKCYTWAHENELGDRNELIDVRVMQIPLILGWATTVHRSQGLTLDCVEVDLGAQIFSSGMAYVALSRVRELSSLSFLQFSPEKVSAKEIVKDYYDYVARNGTHAGFLSQINHIAWPRIADMRRLAAQLPALTEQRAAARARREEEAIAREEAVGDMDLAAAYELRLQEFNESREKQMRTLEAAATATAQRRPTYGAKRRTPPPQQQHQQQQKSTITFGAPKCARLG